MYPITPYDFFYLFLPSYSLYQYPLKQGRCIQMLKEEKQIT